MTGLNSSNRFVSILNILSFNLLKEIAVIRLKNIKVGIKFEKKLLL